MRDNLTEYMNSDRQAQPPSVLLSASNEPKDAIFSHIMEITHAEMDIDNALIMLDAAVGSHENQATPAEVTQWKEALRMAKQTLGGPGAQVSRTTLTTIQSLCAAVKTYAQAVCEAEEAKEHDEHEHYAVAIHAEEAAHKTAVKAAAAVVATIFKPTSSKNYVMDTPEAKASRAALQERDRFIVSDDGHGHKTRSARWIRGNDTGRSLVDFAERNLGSTAAVVTDEVVHDTVATVRKTGVGVTALASGAGSIVTGDVDGARRSARVTSRGLRRTLDRFVGDENAEWLAHNAGNVLETAGVAGATGVKAVKDTAGAAYQWGHDLIWGAPPEKAKPATVSLNGRNVEWHQAITVMRQNHIAITDSNHDGKYSVEEVRASAANWNRAQAASRAAVGTARSNADTNHDGKLTQDEINAAIRRAGKTFAQADTNHDGRISNGELTALHAPAATPAHAKPAARTPAKPHH